MGTILLEMNIYFLALCNTDPINKFTPDTRIHQYAQAYLLKNTWRPAVVTLTDTWQRFSLDVSTPDHALDGDTSWAFFQLEGAGKALVDLFELVEQSSFLMGDSLYLGLQLLRVAWG